METHPHRGEHLFPLLHGTQLVQLYAAQLVPPGVALGGVGAVMAMLVTVLFVSGSVLGPGMVRLKLLGNKLILSGIPFRVESFSASNIAKILGILSVFGSDIGTWRFIFSL